MMTPDDVTTRARELHHRVKNSLQVIASVLRLQMRQEASPAAQEALAEAVRRVQTVATLHDLLARGGTECRLLSLVSRLIDLNRDHLLLPGQTLAVEAAGEDVEVDADRAVAFGMAANELVVNALRHGLSGRDKGRLRADVRRDGDRVRVRLADDGGRLPEGTVPGVGGRLGLRLVKRIVESDLRGTLALAVEDGWTVAEIRLPIS